jgi:hypothetical protein
MTPAKFKTFAPVEDAVFRQVFWSQKKIFSTFSGLKKSTASASQTA